MVERTSAASWAALTSLRMVSPYVICVMARQWAVGTGKHGSVLLTLESWLPNAWRQQRLKPAVKPASQGMLHLRELSKDSGRTLLEDDSVDLLDLD